MKLLMPLVFLLHPSLAGAQPPSNYQLDKDWLVDNAGFEATIDSDTSQQTLTLSNGLFERVIDARLGTTVKFTNLMTGDSIIRAVEPEGSVTLDGVTYVIGGAQGQPNKAFLTDDWLAKLKPLPNSLKLVNYSIGKPAERLKWKRVRHTSPDAVWPPKGAYIRLDYAIPEPSADELFSTALPDSDFGRTALFTDTFEKLDASWKIHSSKAHPRASFSNEGKPGEIYTLPHTAVYAERPLPEGTSIVEATIAPGTDTSSSWGPGIGLVYKNRTIKFNIRPAGLSGITRPVLGVFDGTNEVPHVSGNDTIDLTKPITLRIRIATDKLYFDAQPQGGHWKHYYTQPIPANLGDAIAFRVGKLDKTGGSTDASKDGELVRLRINQVAFYGAFEQDKLAELRKMQGKQKNVTVSVHYEIYDGIPALSKWVTVSNQTSSPINLDKFNAETLSVVENDNTVETREGVALTVPRSLHVETDMAFGGFTHANSSRHSVHWHTDATYKTQVNYLLQQPCLLKVEPAYGPDQTIKAGENFESFRVFEMAYDSEDRERRGLALRKLYRTLAPWVTENPLMLHCKSSHEETVRKAIDQAAETGFEMVILSFGSGFNSENDNPDYLSHWKGINDYATQKGIHLGSYSLYSSRNAGKGNNIVTPPGQHNAHGQCPAITSPWGQAYLKKLYKLFDKTEFMVFENDGPYPGDVDITARPPLQKGINDSRWVHWRTWTDFYKHLRAKGVYMNLPDYYFMSGSNKCGMGYREVNWSLPREQQRIHTRQNIYDGTWQKTPSMGWMFVPLTQYHGGGAEATIEPLDQHRDHYEIMMRSNLGLGVQACYRGPRLYDTDKTRKMVTDTVAWYKKHRAILESDLIHGRRADGRDIDWMLHVNPKLDEKAFLSAYNPTGKEMTRTILVPLYYSGLRSSALVSVDGRSTTEFKLDNTSRAKLTVTIPAHGYSYAIFK
ncbi:MAG: hypothetical protein H7A51_02990 [Akkermansiaceae bacterium]|nr:hypothetical protein [Akkermansiaceae bacterium]